MIDKSFDNELLKISFLKKHPSYLPYVGINYKNAKLKILHIANCHYIEKSQDPLNKYGFEYFKNNWFNSATVPLPDVYNLDKQMEECKLNWRNKLTCKDAWNQYCFNTRNVVIEQLTAKRNDFNLVGTLKYNVFTGIIKLLSELAGAYFWGQPRIISNIYAPKDNSTNAKKQSTKIKREKKYNDALKEYKHNIDAYTYVAFTDFHMFPSLNRGESYVLTSLKNAALSEHYNEKDAQKFYDEIVEQSSQTLDNIIDILKPDIILITSECAGKLYCKHRKENNLDCSKIITMPHTNYPRTQEQRNEYKTSLKQKLETIITCLNINSKDEF